jgi:hypothetical protein
MTRTIITTKDVSRMGENQVDHYIQRILKYIPSEIVALYLAVLPFLKDANQSTEFLIAGGLTVVTFLYLLLVQKVKKPMQLILSCVCFALWVFALGGPFRFYEWYTNAPYLPALALGVAMLFIPAFPPDSAKPENR